MLYQVIMLQPGNIVWVKELLVVDKKKVVVTRIKSKDKNMKKFMKREKNFDGKNGANAKKSKKYNV